MYIDLKKYINKDVSLNLDNVIAVAIVGLDKDNKIISENVKPIIVPVKYVLQIMTCLQNVIFQIEFNSRQKAEDMKNSIIGEILNV